MRGRKKGRREGVGRERGRGRRERERTNWEILKYIMQGKEKAFF